MANLPKGLTLSLMQTKWASILDPVISNPSSQSLILNGINLVSGANTINHKLGRDLVGWRIIRINAAATVYDTQASNPSPQTTLQLVSSAAATVSLEVF